jgi:hypothetical protein
MEASDEPNRVLVSPELPGGGAMRLWIAVAGIVAVAACGSGHNPSSSSSSGSSKGPALSAAQSICQLYLSCLSMNDSDEFPTALPTYGPSGSCWQSSGTSADCEQVCVAGLMQWNGMVGDGTTYPCPNCSTDSDCGSDAATCCDGTCTDAKTDNDNCGTCGSKCKGSGSCSAGECQCDAGAKACGDECVDLQTDSNNCGACGNACGTNINCSGGACSSCTGMEQSCNGTCVDVLGVDNNNCGGCGVVCPSTGAGCLFGACLTTSMDANATCATVCTALGAGFQCITENVLAGGDECQDPGGLEGAPCTESLTEIGAFGAAGCGAVQLSCTCKYSQ